MGTAVKKKGFFGKHLRGGRVYLVLDERTSFGLGPKSKKNRARDKVENCKRRISSDDLGGRRKGLCIETGGEDVHIGQSSGGGEKSDRRSKYPNSRSPHFSIAEILK